VLSLIVRLLRLASIVICLIVAASFLVFAINQTKSASGEQQEALGGPSTSQSAGSANPNSGSAPNAKHHENKLHKALDEASEELTSPFSGIVSSASSEWANRGIRLVLALLVYGFGLGYVARVLRVRV
jgi:hypothetical protein